MTAQLARIDHLLTSRIGGSDAFSALARACDELIAELGDPKPPISLAPLARLLGAKLNYDNRRGVGREEAALRVEDGKYVLWVSRTHFENNRRRARFSIAHEIGHLLLFKLLGPEILNYSDIDQATYKYTERLCDFAGARILMPPKMFDSALSKRTISLARLREVESLFDVSTSAVLKAVADRVQDGAVFELRKFRRRSSEQIEWRIWSAFTGQSSQNLSSWLPTGCTLKHLEGLSAPDSLEFEKPEHQPDLRLIRGSHKVAREGVAVRSISATAEPQHHLMIPQQSRLHGSDLVEERTAGRLMLIVGRQGHPSVNFGLERRQ